MLRQKEGSEGELDIPLPSTGCGGFSACPRFGCSVFLSTPPLTPNEVCILGHVGLGKVTCSSSQLLALHPLSVLKHRLLLGGIPWLSNPGVPNLQAANWYLLSDQWRH